MKIHWDKYIQAQKELWWKVILSKDDRKLWVPSHTY
jgi:hypothetical protein